MKNHHMAFRNNCLISDIDAPDVLTCPNCQRVRRAVARKVSGEWPEVVLEDVLDAEEIEGEG